MNEYLFTIKQTGEDIMSPRGVILCEVYKCEDIFNAVMFITSKYPEKEKNSLVENTIMQITLIS